MTEREDAQLEGAQEEREVPTPAISAGSEDAGSRFDANELASKVTGQIMEQLSAIIDDRVDARFKSAKDKRFAKVEEILEAVKASGGDPEKIRGSLEQQELLSRMASIEAKLGSTVASGKAGSSDLEQATVKLLEELEKKYGASLSDDELAQLAGSKEYRSNESWLKDVGEQVVKKAKQGAVGSAATVGATGKSAVSDKSTADEIADQLQSLQRGEQGNPFSPENMNLRAELTKRLNELEPQVNVDDPDIHLDLTALREGY